jgi:hypothetical protein
VARNLPEAIMSAKRQALVDALELLAALQAPSFNGPPESRPNINAAFIKARALAEKAAKDWLEEVGA